MQTLKGRTCVFAGATAGDGVDSVKALCSAGMNVVIMTNKPERAQKLIDDIKRCDCPGDCIAYGGDPGIVAEHCDETYKKLIQKYGSVDVIISNIGNNGQLADIEDTTGDMLSESLEKLVVKGYKMLHTALPYLKQSKAPRVIFMTSVEGCSGGTHESFVNAVAKGAIRSLTLNAASRLAHLGITVNCISKGAIPRIEPQPENAPNPYNMLPHIPLRRLGTRSDLAQTICFLASEESAYITGQIMELNGGLNLGR